MALEYMRETLGGLRTMQSLASAPLEHEYKQLRNLKLARELQEPTEREKIAFKEQTEWAKYTINKFTDLIKDPEASKASRTVLKGLLEDFGHSLPKPMRAAVLPALGYSPVGPVEKQLEKLDRAFPRPQRPNVPETAENRSVWAQYKWARAQRKFHERQLLGFKEAKLQRLMPTDDSNVYSFHDPDTNEIGFIDMSKVPQDELTRAVDEYGATFAGITERGTLPVAKPKDYTVGEMQYRLRRERDLRSGELRTVHEPIGEAAGKRKAMSSHMRDFMGVINGFGDSGDLDPRMQHMADLVGQAKAALERGETKPKALARVNQELLTMGENYALAPASEGLKESWWSWFPGADLYTMEDGSWMAVPIHGTKRHIVDGEMKTFYWNKDQDVAVDARMRPIPESRGKGDGEELDLKARPQEEPKEVTRAKEATNLMARAVEREGLKVGDVLVMAMEALEEWPEGEREGAREKVRKMLSSYGGAGDEPIPADELVRMIWEDVEPYAEDAAMMTKFIWAWLDSLGQHVAKPVGKLFRWIYEFELAPREEEE